MLNLSLLDSLKDSLPHRTLLQPPLVNILRCSVINKDKALHELPFTEIVKYETVRLAEGFSSFTELLPPPPFKYFALKYYQHK